MRKRLVCEYAVLIGGVVLGFFLMAPASPARAFCRLTTQMPTPGNNCAQGGIGLTWKRQCISFSLTDRQKPAPPLEQIRQAADRSFATWNAVSCDNQPLGLSLAQTVELGTCNQPEYSTHAPNANTIIFVNDWAARELPQDAFGLTLVWHNPDTGEIYDADMQLNETLGSLTVCDASCPPGGVDLQNVMTHEAGHFLGLGHSAVRGATMSARATVGEISKRVLADDDKQGLCSIYAGIAAKTCSAQDYVPNHGFSSSCAPASSNTSTRSLGCSAGAIGRQTTSTAAGALFWSFMGLYLLRLRVRVPKSSARPRPTTK